MAQSNFRLKNRYSNYYESEYHRLKDTSQIFNDIEKFDENWDKVANGESKEFQNLDTYIGALDKAASKNLTYDTISNRGIRTGDAFLLSLLRETLPDEAKTELHDREEIALDKEGRPIQNADGTYQMVKTKMSDYDYLGKLLKEYDTQQYEIKRLQNIEELKKSNKALTAWANFTAGAGEFMAGIYDATAGFMKYSYAATEWLSTVFSKGFKDANKAAVNAVVDFGKHITFDKDFKRDLLRVESEFSNFRTSDGQQTTVGKWVGGLTYTFGQMVPGMLVGNTLGLIGNVGKGATAGKALGTALTTSQKVAKGVSLSGKVASSLIFYEAMAANSVEEMYTQMAEQGITINSGYLLANANIKAAAQFGVEYLLGRLLKTSSLDKLVFGRTGGKLTSITSKLTPTGEFVANTAMDFVEEGLEEVLQDLSDFFVDKVFDAYAETNFRGINGGITGKALAESFVMGGLASLVGSTVNFVTQKRVDSAKILLDKDGNPIIDKEATAQTREDFRKQLYDESVSNKKELTDKQLDLVTAAYMNTHSVYKVQKMSKFESMRHDLNLQSLNENYEKLNNYFIKVKKSGDTKAIAKCEKAYAQLYAVSRVLSSMYEEIGEDSFKRADEILTMIKDGKYDAVSTEVVKVMNAAESAKLSAQNTSADSARKRVEALQVEALDKSKPKELSAATEQKLTSVLTDKGTATAENIVAEARLESLNAVNTRVKPRYDRKTKTATVAVSQLNTDNETIIFNEISETQFVDDVYELYKSNKLTIADSELKTLKDAYYRIYYKKDASAHDVVEALCLSPEYVTEVLYSAGNTRFLFDTVLRIQSAIKLFSVSNAFEATLKNKYTELCEQMKSAISDFIIETSLSSEMYADYNIFTKEEFERLQKEKYESSLFAKFDKNFRDRSNLANIRKLAEVRNEPLVVHAVDMLLNNNLSLFETPGYVSTVRKYLKKISSISNNTEEFLSNDTPGNRAFNNFLRDKHLTRKTIGSLDWLTDSDLDVADAMNIAQDPIEIAIAEFRQITHNIYDVKYIENYSGSPYFIVTQSPDIIGKTDRDVAVYTYLNNNMAAEELSEDFGTFDKRYAIRDFDRKFGALIMRFLLGKDASDVTVALTTLQDVIDNPELLSDYVKAQLDNDFTENNIFKYINKLIRDLTGHTLALGRSNLGTAIVYNSYKISDYSDLSENDFKSKFKEGVYTLSDFGFKKEFLDTLYDPIKIVIKKHSNDTTHKGSAGYYSAIDKEIVVYLDYVHDITDAERNVITKIRQATFPEMIDSLFHEFQHYIQDLYKMQNGTSFKALYKVVSDEIELADDVDPLQVELLVQKYRDVLGATESELPYKDALMQLSDIIYYNSDELFARGEGFIDYNKFEDARTWLFGADYEEFEETGDRDYYHLPTTAYLTPVILRKRDNGMLTINVLGIDIDTARKYKQISLSSPLFSNVYDILNIKQPGLDTELFDFKSNVRLQTIDPTRITEQHTKESIDRLYNALGGDDQFDTKEQFYNTRLPALFFEEEGSSIGDYCVATIANVDKVTIERLMGFKKGKLYVGYVKPADILYFEANKYRNTIVEKSKVFKERNSAIAIKQHGHLQVSYKGDVVTANTHAINQVKVEDINLGSRRFDPRKDRESAILLADHQSTVKNLNETYSAKNAKVIRAEYVDVNGTRNNRAIRFYFDKPISETRDYVTRHYHNTSSTLKGVHISKKKTKNSLLRNFAGKNRSKEFQAFVREIDKFGIDNVPEILRDKIKNGTLRIHDIDAYIRKTDFADIDEDIFALANKTIYKNLNIKTVEELQTLVNEAPRFYAMGIVFYILNKQDWLDNKYKASSLAEIYHILTEEDPALGVRIDKRISHYTEDFDINEGYLKMLFLRKYDGTIISAFRAANFAKLADENEWKITGAIQSDSLDKENTNSKTGQTYNTYDAEAAADLDTMRAYLGETYYNKLEEIRQLAKMEFLASVKLGLIKNVDANDTKAIQKKLDQFTEESEEWDTKKIDRMFKAFDAKRADIDALYLQALAANITGNDVYYTDEKTAEKIGDSVNKILRKPDNIIRNIKYYTQKIKSNVAEAERKDFFKTAGNYFNNDFTVKDELLYDLAQDNSMVPKSVDELLEVEDKFKDLYQFAKSHALSDKKLAQWSRQTEHAINRAKSEVQRLKKKVAELREGKQITKEIKQFVVNDIAIDVKTDTELPSIFKALLNTEFDKTSKTQIKFNVSQGGDEELRHVRVETAKFYADNAEILRGMTSDEARELCQYFANSNVFPTTNKFAVYVAAEVATIIYLKKDYEANNLLNISPEQYKAISDKLNTMKSVYGQGMATIREFERRTNSKQQTKIVLKAIAKHGSISITNDQMTRLAAAVDSGDYDRMAKEQAAIYEEIRQKYADVDVNIWDKLLKFSRVAMLSNPGTWVRNKVSNVLVDKLNTLAEKANKFITDKLDKIILKKHEQHKEAAAALITRPVIPGSKNTVTLKPEQLTESAREQYEKEYLKTLKTHWINDETIYKDLHLVKTSDKVAEFMQRELLDSGLLELIEDGSSKYEDSIGRKTDVNTDITNLIADTIRTRLFTANITKNEVLTKWYNFIYSQLSDNKWIRKTFLKYLGKTLTYDNTDIRHGITKDVMTHIANAYTLALYDYMHKPNFVTSVERKLREKFGPAGFYVYKSIFPFLGASMNWFVEGLKYTPVGLAWNIMHYVNLEKVVDTMSEENKEGRGVSYRFAQYLTSRDIGKGVIGTIGFVIGMMFAGFGLARIDDNDDKLKLYVPGANFYIDISDVFGTQGILNGIALISAIKDKEHTDALSIVKFVLDQMYADSTVSSFFNTIRQTDNVTDYLETIPFNMINNLIPNIISVASSFNAYKNKYHSGILGKLEKTLVKAAPTLSYALPKYIDPYTGQKQVQYKLFWFTKLVNKLGPIDVYPYNVSNTEKIALDLGIHTGNLNASWSINDEKLEFTGSKRQALNMFYGKLNKSALEKFINNKTKYVVVDEKTNTEKELYYKQMTKQQRKLVIERILASDRTLTKIYAATSTSKYRYYTSEKEYQALKKLGIHKNVYVKTKDKSGYYKIK